MKTSRGFRFITAAVIAAAMTGGGGLLTTDVEAASPFGKAAGKYTGKLKGKAKALGQTIAIPKTLAKAKMPRGKGKCVLRIQGFPALKGKVRKAKAVQGGKKVIQIGKIRVPASQTQGLGTLSGPFRSVIIVKAGRPKMKAKTSFSPGFGVNVTGKFVGTK